MSYHSMVTRYSIELFSLTKRRLGSLPSFLLIPVLVTAGMYFGWSRIQQGVSFWPTTVMGGDISLTALGPLLVMTGVWVGRTDQNQALRLLRALASTPTNLLALSSALSVSILGIVSQGIVSLSLVSWSLWRSAFGEVDALGLVSPLLACVVYSFLGYIIGRILPYLLTIPLAGVITFQLPILAFGRPDASRLLMPYHSELVDVWSVWVRGLYAKHALYLACIILLLASILLLLNSQNRRFIGAVAIFAALSAGAGVWVSDRGNTFYAAEIPPFDYSCTKGVFEVCVHPAFAPGISKIVATYAPVAQRLEGTPGQIVVLQQRPRGVGQAPDAGAVAFHIDGLSRVQLNDSLDEFVTDKLNQDACIKSLEKAPQNAAFTDAVSSYIRHGNSPLVMSGMNEAQDIVAKLNAMTSQDRQMWLTANWEKYTRCELTSSDFSTL